MSKLSCQVATLQLQGPRVSIYVTSLEIIALQSCAQSRATAEGLNAAPPGLLAALTQHPDEGGASRAPHPGSLLRMGAGKQSASSVLAFPMTGRREWSPSTWWMSYSQTICPSFRKDAQSQPEGHRCCGGAVPPCWSAGRLLCLHRVLHPQREPVGHCPGYVSVCVCSDRAFENFKGRKPRF